MHEALTRVTGVRRRRVPMPGPLLRFAGRTGDLVKRVLPFEFPLTLEAMTLATRARDYDSSAACAALGVRWRPVDETLRDSVRWLAVNGHVPAKIAGVLAP
jgi:dihydroflavonol-4-reductase